LRAALWDRVEEGRASIDRAAELGAELDHVFWQFVTSHLLNQAEEFGEDAASAALVRVAWGVRRVGGRRAAGQLKACYLVNRAFRAFRVGDTARVPGLVVRALANDPSYMANRGVMAMMLRSVGDMRAHRHAPADRSAATTLNRCSKSATR
jgi:hypothetical protein